MTPSGNPRQWKILSVLAMYRLRGRSYDATFDTRRDYPPRTDRKRSGQFSPVRDDR